MERKAYQKRLIECSETGYKIEEAKNKVKRCELELLACRLPQHKKKEEISAKKQRQNPHRRPVQNRDDTMPKKDKIFASANRPTKDPLYEAPSFWQRLLGIPLVIITAFGLIYYVIKKS
jgi:hypothetical protein